MTAGRAGLARRGWRPDGRLALLAGLGVAYALATRRDSAGSVGSFVRADGGAPPVPGEVDERGRGATTPIDIPPRGWKDILFRTFEQVNADRVMAVGAGVTFYGLLALFPTLTALVSIYGLFTDPSTMAEHLNLLSGILPSGATDIVAEQMHRLTSQPNDHLSIGFALGLVIALWSSNAGTKALFDALNVTYGERETRGFIKLNLVTLTFTLVGLLFMLSALAAIVVLPLALGYVGMGDRMDILIGWGRWPVLTLVIILALAVLYRFGPSRTRAQWRWITPGSVLAACVWLVASLLFSWYVSEFGNYNKTYGSLGAIIGFMTWMWISSVIVLMGAELNAEIEHQTARDTTGRPHRPMGQRGAAVADTVGEKT